MKTLKLQDVFAHGAGAAATLFAILLALAPGPVWAQDVQFTADGSLNQPQGYREWVYVGTPLTPNDMNEGEGEVLHLDGGAMPAGGNAGVALPEPPSPLGSYKSAAQSGELLLLSGMLGQGISRCEGESARTSLSISAGRRRFSPHSVPWRPPIDFSTTPAV